MTEMREYASMDEAIEIALGHLNVSWQDDSFGYEYGDEVGIHGSAGWVVEDDRLEVVAKIKVDRGWIWGEGYDGGCRYTIREGLIVVLTMDSLAVERKNGFFICYAVFGVEEVG